jgi:hypothetical protein
MASRPSISASSPRAEPRPRAFAGWPCAHAQRRLLLADSIVVAPAHCTHAGWVLEEVARKTGNGDTLERNDALHLHIPVTSPASPGGRSESEQDGKRREGSQRQTLPLKQKQPLSLSTWPAQQALQRERLDDLTNLLKSSIIDTHLHICPTQNLFFCINATKCDRT